MKHIFLVFCVVLSCNAPYNEDVTAQDELISKTDSIIMVVDDKLIEVEKEKQHKEFVLDSLKKELELKTELREKLLTTSNKQKVIKTIYYDTVTFHVDSSYKK
jgi:hypothetical protein